MSFTFDHWTLTAGMPSNKLRLYVGLHQRGGKPTMPGNEDTYHWSLIVGPKKEKANSKGWRYHAKNDYKNDQVVWTYERARTTLYRDHMLLVRVMVAKIVDLRRFEQVLDGLPVDQGKELFNCVTWLKDALTAVCEDGQILGNNRADWQTVRDTAMQYCQKKKDQGHFRTMSDEELRIVSTYDLLLERETAP